ncbi:polysaccharide deacetylase family protein [Anaeroselena agilis]|uniref:Polysaccharide deacetylase family protein n=1 Tax=Anaeroselena agilis TaxID=3063788 RepID=A0ABU3P1B6_9FIRM|nr:polysaccharide deacetylase family protein [Selenomonadales bacterium 4137-cl]
MRIAIIGAIIMAVFLGAQPAAAAPPAVVDKAPAAKAVALTIEDLEDAAEVAAVLKLCREEKIKVTFFIKGEALAGLPVKQAVADGHEFGNHGLRHDYWAEAGVADIAADLTAGAKAVQAAAGLEPRVLRPPYSYYGDNFRQAAAGLTPPVAVVRGVDAGDWLVDSAEAVVEQLKGAVAGGAIVNINMKLKTAAAALPAVVGELKARGFELVTASELLRKIPPPVAVTPTVPSPAGGSLAVLRRSEAGRPYVALTFDDGGPAWRVNEILDVLKEAGVRSTFFLLGEWVRANPDEVRRIVAEGHEIANHSYSHPRFSWLDAAGMREEILAAGAALREVTGREGARFFRPPYGVYNGTLTGVLGELGYRAMVMWDVDSRDWSGLSAEKIARQVTEETADGSVVLFHLHGANTAGALREIIPALRAKGYGLTTIGAIFGDGATDSDGIKKYNITGEAVLPAGRQEIVTGKANNIR